MTQGSTTKRKTGRLTFRLKLSAGVLGLLAGLGVMTAVTPAQSESLGYVTLEEPAGHATVWGELLSFDGKTYLLRSNVGTMEIAADMVRCIGEACPVIPKKRLGRPGGGDVVLKAHKDGSEIRGQLIGFDGRAYDIRTVLGDFRVAVHIAECHGAGCPQVETHAPKFAVYGFDGAMRRLLPGLWRGFAEANGYSVSDVSEDGETRTIILRDAEEKLVAEIDLRKGDTKGAMGALSSGEAEMAILEMSPDAAREGSSVPEVSGQQQALLGYDGLVVVANNALPVRDLAAFDLRRIWNGELRTWQPLGGGDFPITVHVAERSFAQTPTSLFKLASLKEAEPGNIIYHQTEEDVIAAIEADRNAIGVVHHDTASIAHTKMLGFRKSCGLTASPSAFDMQIDQYPLTLPIKVYGKGPGIHPVAEAFIEWSRTTSAQRYVGDAGYTTVGLKRMKIRDMGMSLIHTAAVEPDFDGLEFASMMRELRYADRLSISFRFLPGSSRLDEDSVKNIRYLAERLRAREFDGQELLLVGFADNIGPADRNTVLAAQRAEAEREVLVREFDTSTLNQIDLRAMSFGEQMPIDCNDTESGRASNRRVEVWTRVSGGV